MTGNDISRSDTATAFDRDAEIGRIARTWHALEASAALEALASRIAGLDDAEAAQRLARFGRNELPAPPARTLLRRFLDQLNNVLIYVLLAAALITALLGHAVDTGVIVGVVVINAIFGVLQEGKAERALDAIRAMIAPIASVIRAGRRVAIPAAEAVPGDIVLLDAGDRVIADVRLISAAALRIDESALTGESVPVDKRPQADSPDAVLAERASMAYSGTLVTKGQGTGVVVATGPRTELGRITTILSTITETTTPLIRQMNRFAQQLTIVILALAAAIFAFALLVRGYPLSDAFIAVVGIAVAAIPEGLPAVLTVTLAIGVERMSRRNAIIRQLPAVETLGSVSIICTDKTGTLTLNEMTARHVATAAGVYAVSGAGYGPEGTITPTAADPPDGASDDAGLRAVMRVAVLCNDAHLVHDGGTWSVGGDPMEGALLALAAKAGLDADTMRKEQARIALVPFDAQHRFMATLNAARGTAAPSLLVKGAPEEILALCTGQLAANGEVVAIDPARWQDHVAGFARQGERTLAFALREMQAKTHHVSLADARDLVLVGVVSLIDPPRDEARRAIAECREAGIDVKMITGDHALTAAAIAGQLGLGGHSAAVSGSDIEAADAATLTTLARSTGVFARTSPEHKLRLVEALRADGSIIAMTGDGVNDAPALKSADVGIAMGRKGTEAAKEASQMVLADDNFASIVAAVKEGRTVYDNLTKVISWTLPTNFGEAMVVVAAILGGFLLPITPVQILWVNMVTAVALGLVLAFEPAEPDVMKRPPRAALGALLTPALVWQIVLVSVLFMAGVFTMFWWATHRGLPLEEARTIAVNTLVALEIFYLFSVRYLRMDSITIAGVVGTPAVLIGVGTIVALQFGFTYVPFMQRLFGTAAVSLRDGLVIVAAGVLLLIALDVEKRIRRRLDRPRAP
mgnify:CR=1 FL=1